MTEISLQELVLCIFYGEFKNSSSFVSTKEGSVPRCQSPPPRRTFEVEKQFVTQTLPKYRTQLVVKVPPRENMLEVKFEHFVYIYLLTAKA